jgi:hypothetical protein
MWEKEGQEARQEKIKNFYGQGEDEGEGEDLLNRPGIGCGYAGTSCEWDLGGGEMLCKME